MTSSMLNAAIYYHLEGLCVIPCRPRDKNPIVKWKHYQTNRSTEVEIHKWFSNGHNYNVGIVHGEVSNNYIVIDIDHDTGVFAEIKKYFPELFTGRIEQSGSWEGYHLPLHLGTLPDFGLNNKGELKGNRTWHVNGLGDVNIRARISQTVVPPSIHPSGQPYRFIQQGPITQTPNLNSLIAWLNKIAPPKVKEPVQVKRQPVRPGNGDTLLDAVLDAWPNPLAVFEKFGLAGKVEGDEREVKLRGNGGLWVNLEKNCWTDFADETGGGVIQAWGWCRFGTSYDKRGHFRQVLVEMAEAAGIDVAAFHRPGDERLTREAPQGEKRDRWASEYDGYWGQMR